VSEIAGGADKRRDAIRNLCSLVCMAAVLCAKGKFATGAEIPGCYQDPIGNDTGGIMRDKGTTEEKGVEDLKINSKQINYNRTPLIRTANNIQYIVIHDTANFSKGAGAEMHFNYFNGGNKNASADFFVDDKQTLQINDYFKFYTWAVGDGHSRYGISNRNSVSIEICVNPDSNYDVAFEKTIELTKHLMNALNVPAERVVRHYDASRKPCPISMMQNNWARWERFKMAISNNKENEEIKLQKNLYELGYKLTIDGIIGPQTKGYLSDFQYCMSINTDGVYGPETKKKLDEVMMNERLVIIYRSVNILSSLKKQGKEQMISDKRGWIKKATTDTGLYWLLKKVAEFNS